eukprot:TRINITY_DN3236_c0_g1_i11.p1 TRINITY_DN3236_c0_g1~~TRINITY_DN3236_c0_g1_i11.p1  ORF type:complete len:304 (+),score=94.08 TRINITY_DN3236_c0_g1_i11:141-1052(+)
MSSLPTEIDPVQEQLLNSILDEGIKELRTSMDAEEPYRSQNTSTELSHLQESPHIKVKRRVSASYYPNTSLAQVISEVKNSKVLQEDKRSEDYSKLQSELSFLQSKIHSLETCLTQPYKSPAKHAAIRSFVGKTALVQSQSVKGRKESSPESSEESSDSVESARRDLKRSASRKSVRSSSVASLRGNYNGGAAKATRVESKYIAMKKQFEETKQKLVKERQKTHELKTKLEKYEREYNMRKSVYEELKELKAEYEQLKLSFEKSEKLRRHQKEVIKELQEEREKSKEEDKSAKIKKKKLVKKK